MDFFRFDAPRHYDFPPLPIFSSHKYGDRFRGRHRLVCVIVVTHPNQFIIRDAEVNRANGPTAAAFQLAQPLM
jgi:hypothetical protein